MMIEMMYPIARIDTLGELNVKENEELLDI